MENNYYIQELARLLGGSPVPTLTGGLVNTINALQNTAPETNLSNLGYPNSTAGNTGYSEIAKALVRGASAPSLSGSLLNSINPIEKMPMRPKDFAPANYMPSQTGTNLSDRGYPGTSTRLATRGYSPAR